MAHAVLGLGSNLGSRRALLSAARRLLEAQPGLRVLRASSLYHTPPLGPPQPDYINAALLVSWPGTVRGLLAIAQYVEAQLLRQRTLRWGPRTLDLDLLFWSGGSVREHDLHVPHPGLHSRAFALAPLLEVALEVAPELASEYAPSLSKLGGAPPSEPWMRACELEDGGWVTAPHHELSEQLCALVAAYGAATAAPAEARELLTFRVPKADWIDALRQRVRAASAHDFHVAAAAVTHVAEESLAGLLLGARTARASALEMPRCEPLPGASPARYRVFCSMPFA